MDDEILRRFTEAWDVHRLPLPPMWQTTVLIYTRGGVTWPTWEEAIEHAVANYHRANHNVVAGAFIRKEKVFYEACRRAVSITAMKRQHDLHGRGV